jgi:uncharacterized protein (TIGR02145 family)
MNQNSKRLKEIKTMKPLLFIRFLTFPIVLSLFALSCVFPQLSGNSSEVDNKTLCGILFEPDGKTRAQGASVVLRSRDFLSAIPTLQKRNAGNPYFVDSTRTNDTGFYRFDSITYGLYCIEGRDGKNNCVFIDSIAISAEKKNQPFSDTLKQTGAIKGIVQLIGDTAKAIIRVFGLDVYAKADSGGNFLIENLPAGNMRLQILILQGSTITCDTFTVAVKAGETGMRKCKVTFDSRSGSTVASQLVDAGAFATQPPTPTNKAVSFAGWYKEPACTTEWQFTKVKVVSPMTLYAKWIVVDVDGNDYSTVIIGRQMWLARNLKTTKFNDSTAIPSLAEMSAWDSLSTPAYNWDNDVETENKDSFSVVYNWHSVNTGKLAPRGWHVSSEGEWDTLQNTLLAQGFSWNGTKDNTIAKALAAQSRWDSSTNIGAIGNDLTKNNKSGFSAVPSGYYAMSGRSGSWWTTRELNATDAVIQIMGSDDIVVHRSQSMKVWGLSVRCVRDE